MPALFDLRSYVAAGVLGAPGVRGRPRPGVRGMIFAEARRMVSRIVHCRRFAMTKRTVVTTEKSQLLAYVLGKEVILLPPNITAAITTMMIATSPPVERVKPAVLPDAPASLFTALPPPADVAVS